jgi:hypothetical protein
MKEWLRRRLLAVIRAGFGAVRSGEAGSAQASKLPSQATEEDLRDVEALFDAEFYLEQNPDVGRDGVDPFTHFIAFGWREGRNPSREFDTNFYLAANQDVRLAALNPLTHYARYGRLEGRLAMPPQGPPAAASEAPDYEAAAALFDAAYYLSANPDVGENGGDPLTHFMSFGWREGRNPSADFDTSFYLSNNPDVRLADVNPLVHYARHGRDEGRAAVQAPQVKDAPPDRRELHAASALFDAAYYVSQYPDVAETGQDPLTHFMSIGWTEGRNPSALFTVNDYLRHHPDVRDSGVNPLLHYALYGRHEGRTLGPDPNSPRIVIEQAQPSAVRARAWLRPRTRADLGRRHLAARLTEAGDRRYGDAPMRLMVSISHDDYMESVGGTQNIIGDEMRVLLDGGWTYLHIRPAQPLPMLAPPGVEPLVVGCRVDGQHVGFALLDDVVEVLDAMRGAWRVMNVVVHHLLGHRPEDVAALIDATRPDRTYVFLHDFFVFCPSYALLRNNATYCGAPPPTSGSCMVCCYGDERPLHLARIGAFLDEVRPTMCIYSEAARALWDAKSAHAFLDVLQLTLASLDLHAEVPAGTFVGRTDVPLRVAFVGTPAHLKGWNVFASLAKSHFGDARYEFVQFSTQAVPQLNVRHVPVSVGQHDRLAMVRALRAERIDVALIWSLWPETFCFTAYEAMAAGVFVVTYRESGNVWPAIRAHGERQGCCLESTQELVELFASGDILALACARGRRSGDLVIEAPLARHLVESFEALHA